MSNFQLPQDLVRFRDTYHDMFGSIPPNLDQRFAISGELDADFLRLHEQMRARVFQTDLFDAKTLQLIVFGQFLALQSPAARMHALGARRAGASWEEIHRIIEIAATTAGFGCIAVGDQIIAELREKEAGNSSKQ
jgi:alkylhydroperoxidase/carboxymuconolactone decarboxylase family protein YurZ